MFNSVEEFKQIFDLFDKIKKRFPPKSYRFGEIKYKIMPKKHKDLYIELFYTPENVLMKMKGSDEVWKELVFSGKTFLRYNNTFPEVNFMNSESLEKYIHEYIDIENYKDVIFLPNLQKNFWEVLDNNVKSLYPEYWKGDGELKVKIKDFEIKIPCIKKIYSGKYGYKLWYGEFNLDKIDNKLLKNIISRKLEKMQQNLIQGEKDLNEYEIEKYDNKKDAENAQKTLTQNYNLESIIKEDLDYDFDFNPIKKYTIIIKRNLV